MHPKNNGSFTFDPPKLCPVYHLLYLAGSNLYLFPVINHNCEYNRFQWVLCILLVNYWNLGLFGATPKVIVGVRSEGDLVWTLHSNFVVEPQLLVVGTRHLRQTWESKGLCPPPKKRFKRDYPGGPVVKTPHFHRRGRGFNPWLGN